MLKKHKTYGQSQKIHYFWNVKKYISSETTLQNIPKITTLAQQLETFLYSDISK